MIVWSPLLTVNDCCTWGAAFQLALPAWLALIVQVPTVTKVTVVPEMVQTLVVAEVKATVRPEEAVALSVSGPSSKRLSASAVKVIVWFPLLIGNDCCTWGAAFQFAFAGLVGVDRAGADGDEGDGGAGDGADAGGR